MPVEITGYMIFYCYNRGQNPVNKKTRFYSDLSIILLLLLIQSLPVVMLKPSDTEVLKGNNVIVYYNSSDKAGATKVFEVLETGAEGIRKKLDFENSDPIEVYVYKNQESLWIRKYGLVTLLGAPEWYIGDNKGDKVLIVSPDADTRVHNSDSILSTALHELVHAINYQINPELSYWLDNGLATYLAGQVPYFSLDYFYDIPTLKDLKSENQIRFGEIGGYQYSYTYIEFLDNNYGWDKVLELLRGKKTYEEIFSKSEQDIYEEWVEYLRENY